MIRFIEVTKKHIANGVPGDECNCAIALALIDEYKTSDVSVEVEDEPILYVGDKSLNINSFMESDVLDFIDCFDNQDNMYYPKPKPFTIQVYEEVGI